VLAEFQTIETVSARELLLTDNKVLVISPYQSLFLFICLASSAYKVNLSSQQYFLAKLQRTELN